MTDRWSRLESLFHAAADLPEAERKAFLESATPDDPSLAAEVLDLLAHDQESATPESDAPESRHHLLTRGLAHTAADLLGDTHLPTTRFGPWRLTARCVLFEHTRPIVEAIHETLQRLDAERRRRRPPRPTYDH